MFTESTTSATSESHSEPLTESEAAACLGLKVATLRAWRHQSRGPTFVRLGRAIRYLRADIDAFLAANRHRPESDVK
jgi:predicted DNA-binding transcriptional regulator AlpA